MSNYLIVYHWIDPRTTKEHSGEMDDLMDMVEACEDADTKAILEGKGATHPLETLEAKIKASVHYFGRRGYWRWSGAKMGGYRVTLAEKPSREVILAHLKLQDKLLDEIVEDHSFVTNSGETVVTDDAEFAARARGEG